MLFQTGSRPWDISAQEAVSVCKGHLLLVPTSLHPPVSDHSSSPPQLCSHVVSGVNLSVLFQGRTLVPGLVNQKVTLA